MTTREFLKSVITLAETADNKEVKEKAEALIVALDDKNAKRAAKPSKTAVANEPIKAAIHKYLAENEGYKTAADVGIALEITSHKASALMTQMTAAGLLRSEEVKVPKRGKVKGYTIA